MDLKKVKIVQGIMLIIGDAILNMRKNRWVWSTLLQHSHERLVGDENTQIVAQPQERSLQKANV